MSFGPFLGGKRICLGKTFAELVSKLIGTTLLIEFDYEFLDKKVYKEKP
jgi:cytochrome P450